MAENKYGKYIKKNLAGKSIFEQVAAPQFRINGNRDCEGAGISMNWSYITEHFEYPAKHVPVIMTGCYVLSAKTRAMLPLLMPK